MDAASRIATSYTAVYGPTPTLRLARSLRSPTKSFCPTSRTDARSGIHPSYDHNALSFEALPQASSVLSATLPKRAMRAAGERPMDEWRVIHPKESDPTSRNRALGPTAA